MNDRMAQVLRSGVLLSVLAAAAWASDLTTMVAPFSATCVLLALLPASPFSRPRTIVVSHVLCVGLGLALAFAPIHPLLAAALGVWAGIVGMAVLDSVHAPAVAHTAILLLAKPPIWTFAAAVLGTACVFAGLSFVSLWIEGRRAATAPATAAPST